MLIDCPSGLETALTSTYRILQKKGRHLNRPSFPTFDPSESRQLKAESLLRLRSATYRQVHQVVVATAIHPDP
jgi:hypothetical protein